MILIAAWLVTVDTDLPLDTSPPAATQPTQTTVLTQPTTAPTESSTLPTETEPTEPAVTTEPPVTTVPPATQPTLPPTTAPPPPPSTEPPEVIPVTYDRFSLFSGQYVEDGRDELVENVAAILVTNVTDSFLDLATLTFELDGKTATFVVTGLPAGRSAWVMEQSRMTATHSSTLTYLDCVSSLRDNVITSSQDVTITSEGNTLTARNNTGETLTNVFVYYKVKHTDGNFFGGITYLVSFGDLGPGESAQSMAGHFNESNTEIIRIGWTK